MLMEAGYEPLIHEIFLEIQAEANTYCEPLHMHVAGDMIKTGEAWNVLNEIGIQKLLGVRRRQQETMQTSNDGIWRLIQKLDVSPKVKLFWWRAGYT
jgi:hypothetical protein